MNTAWSIVLASARAIFDVILPEKTRAARIRKRTSIDFPLIPTSHDLRQESITTLLDYKAAGVSDLIRALKYEHSNHAASIAAAILADYLREEIAHMKTFSPRKILLSPVPLHADRVRERGFNQIEKILLKLPAEFRDGPVSGIAIHALSRTRATPQQTRLSRTERIQNVAGAFSADTAQVQNSHIILIDDVTTTGATMTECMRTLRSSGAHVTALALARA